MLNAQCSMINVKLGILGGGQLGRMFIQNALNLNVEVHILDPDQYAPCRNIAETFTVGSLTDFETVYQFGKNLDMITIEIENVNVDALQKLADEGKQVFPQPNVIALIQDKGLQKQFYQKHQIPTASFELFENVVQIQEKYLNGALNFDTVYFQKLRTGGYDGKGVLKIAKQEDLDKLFDAPSILEKGTAIEKEIAVILARNSKGEIAVFPIVEMVFDPQLNLVDYLFAPAQISSDLAQKVDELARQIITKLDMVGILAIEMFVTPEKEILVNEMAPRPHNSGHHTIEANFTSQFEQHLRAIFNLPLGDPSTRNLAAMVNLLGESDFEGEAKYAGLEEVLAMKDVYVHLYGKKTTKAGRKMGHITILNEAHEAFEDLQVKINKVKNTLKVIS